MYLLSVLRLGIFFLEQDKNFTPESIGLLPLFKSSRR